MSEARAHHFISQCYLRSFTRNESKKSKLFVVSLAERKTFESRPSGVAHIRDFNRVDGLAAGEVERMLAGVEGHVAAALRLICTARSLDSDDAWHRVLYLVALFSVRHPVQRAQTEQIAEQAARVLLDLITATPERWAAYQRDAREHGRIGPDVNIPFAEAQAMSQQFTVDVTVARHIGLELMALEQVLETLRRRQWQLFIAGPGAGNFVTSDRPVALAHSDGAPASSQRPLGHGVPGTSLVFPISRELLAVGSLEGEKGVRQLDAEGVALFNAVTFTNAYREVYCADSKDTLLHDGVLVQAADILTMIGAQVVTKRK